MAKFFSATIKLTASDLNLLMREERVKLTNLSYAIVLEVEQ